MVVKNEMPDLQTNAKPMIYVLKILSINKQPELKMRGGNMNIDEFFDVLFLPQICPKWLAEVLVFFWKTFTNL